MSEEKTYDVAILGGGPGGYVAAIRAAQLGLETVLIEKDPFLGGTCLHRGCIPTKALLHYTETVERLAQCADFGIRLPGPPSIDMPSMHSAKAKVVERMSRGLDGLMKKNRIKVVRGHGKLKEPNVLEVEGQQLRAESVILATGSRPSTLPFLKADGERIFTSDEILTWTEIPKRLLILGAGAVGLEFACIYNSLGSRVQVVEMADRPLPIEDREISREIGKAYKKRKIDIVCSVRLEDLKETENSLELSGVSLADGSAVTFQADAVLSAVGRSPVLENVGLEQFSVAMDGRSVRVNQFYQTSEPWLYAIGDIIPGPQLAHLASAEGIVCVEALAGSPTHPIDYAKIPSATYCRPEVASVGLSEEQATKAGYQVAVGRFPWAALGKAAILGETDGLVKIVAEEKYGELLGVHIVGPHATDLIAEACVALSCEATVEELFRTVHAHPTLPEGLMEAAHGVFSQPIHLPPQPSKRSPR